MRKIILALLAAAALTLPVAAAPAKGGKAPPPPLSADEQALLPTIETYLNGIKSLKSQFIQSSDDGGPLATGTFQLLRPGRMRIDYDPPSGNFIVADGRFVYFWDAEVKEQQNAPIGSTLADFLLRDQIRLSGDVAVLNVVSDGGLTEVTLVQAKEPGQGSLTLVFEEKPFALRKWRVLDAQGRTTEVALQNPQFGVSLDQAQFFFRDPGRRRDRD